MEICESKQIEIKQISLQEINDQAYLEDMYHVTSCAEFYYNNHGIGIKKLQQIEHTRQVHSQVYIPPSHSRKRC